MQARNRKKVSCKSVPEGEKTMSEYVAETVANRKRNMSNLLLLMAAIALSSTGVFAQTERTITRVNEDSRAKIIEQMSAEAKRFKLELNPNSLTLHNTDRTLTIGMQIMGAERAKKGDWLKGVDIAFVYLDSDTRNPVPNGFYKVRISETTEEQSKAENSSPGRKRVAAFINAEGRVIKQFPVGGRAGNSEGSPQIMFVRQELFGNGWRDVGYFETRYEYWAWLAGPYGP
jgi:predicted nucleic acid-binding Zn ribbon protein